MRVVGLNGFNQPRSFDYRNSWLNQKFNKRALVLNPDAMAVLIEENMEGARGTNSLLFGETVNVLNGVDHLFSPSTARGGGGHSGRVRLVNHVPSSPLDLVGFLRSQGHHSDAAEYARRVLRVDPAVSDAKGLLKAATRDQSVDKAVEFLRPGLALQPPLLDWHCFYQDIMTARRPEHDLQGEYGLLFRTYPEQSEYLYLLGRVIRNPDTARLYLEKFEESASGNGHGYFTIASRLLCAGRFRESKSYVLRALEKAPDDSGFNSTAEQVHVALRQYEYPLNRVEQRLQSHPDNGELVAEKIKYLTLLGEHQAAFDTINNGADIGPGWLSYFHAVRFYVSGNVKDYLANLEDSGKGNVQLQQYLHSGNAAAASRAMVPGDEHDYNVHLVLFCAASYHGDEELADTQLAKAIDEVGRSTRVQLEISTMLSGDQPPDINRVLTLCLMPREKSILCAALGFKFPDRQAEFFGLSRKFNIMPAFPQLLLKKWTRQRPVRVSDSVR
jgi:tetratricopeptide (TPR) repeat protein